MSRIIGSYLGEGAHGVFGKMLIHRLPALQYVSFAAQIPLLELRDVRKLGLIRRVLPFTMVGYPRLANAYEIALKVERAGIQGAFVECGVWKGGAIGIMARVAHEAQSDRAIWLFDSFEGLPEPTEKDGDAAKNYAGGRSSGDLSPIGLCEAAIDDVEKLLFDILEIDKSNVNIVQGWFQDTMPAANPEMGSIAALRVDADWYASTKCVLENLYDLVVPGGYVILDDYGQ
ncbi:MAG: TylF/MycF/NovP-related O-methyltransferase, partial [Anaerolineales bacterium]